MNFPTMGTLSVIFFVLFLSYFARSLSFSTPTIFSRFLLDSTSQPGDTDTSNTPFSETLCEPVAVLGEWLQTVHEALCPPLFDDVWRRIARLVDSFLFNEVATKCRFDRQGAQQLGGDLGAIKSVFRRYGVNPDGCFSRCVELARPRAEGVNVLLFL